MNSIANPNADQWQDSPKSYKDLIEEGFEVKAYSMNTIETSNGFLPRRNLPPKGLAPDNIPL